MDKVAVFVIGVVLSILFGLAVGGWALMLAIGMLHGWNNSIPTMGFWTAVPIAIVTRILLTSTNASASK